MTLISRIRNSTKVRKVRYAAAARLSRQVPSQQLLLFCNPRGGSTWLTEVLARNLKVPVLWEPLHLRYGPEFAGIYFSWEQIIPEFAEWPEAEAAYGRLFRGRILNPWYCRVSSPEAVARSRQMLIKFCRANGHLPWLTRKFSFRFPPVLLLRHPFAVVASQLNHSGFAGVDGKIRRAGEPFGECVEQHRDFLDTLDTRAERQVASWCLQNREPLKCAPADRRWVTIFYEDLLQDPQGQVSRVLQAWGHSMKELSNDMFRIPSATTVGESKVDDVDRQISKWRNSFSPQTIDRMLRVLDYFEIYVYDDGLRPTAKAREFGY